jgi:cytochrome c
MTGRLLVFPALLLMLSASRSLAGDYVPNKLNGQFLFMRCQTCHAIEHTSKKTGPELKGLFGRRAAAISEFDYSKQMTASGIVWTAETLDQYLENPTEFLPGTLMVYGGLPRLKDRLDLIAYLESVLE